MMPKLKITTDKKEMASADVLVCMPVTMPLVMPDNKVGDCAACGRRIQYRPYAPKKVTRMCVDCVKEIVAEKEARGIKTEMLATPTAIAELIDELKKDRQ